MKKIIIIFSISMGNGQGKLLISANGHAAAVIFHRRWSPPLHATRESISGSRGFH